MAVALPQASTSTDTQTDGPASGLTTDRRRKEESTVSSNRPLTEEQLLDYQEAFREFDKNGDGTISVDELSILVKTLGYDQKEESIQQLVREFDLDENGVIDFDEFVQLMQNQIHPMSSEELIYEAFRNIGGTDDTISTEALKEKAKELGLNFTDEELQDMIEEAAPDDDGKLSYQGLIQFMSGENETLWDAYQRRQVREEHQKEIEERRRQEEAEREEDTNERVPDIEEIASQFDRSNYDEFSRQTNGRQLVKKPGKRVPMSKTRLQYLKRKAEAQGLAIDELVEFHEAEQKSLRRTSSNKELWLGSIHDDKAYDTTFKSNPPRAYRHVESKLHQPTPRNGKQALTAKSSTLKNKHVEKDGKTLVLQTAVVSDFDKELKKIQRSRDGKQTSKSSTDMFPMKLPSKRFIHNADKVNVKSLEGYLARKKQKDAFKVNYSVWKTFFEKAVKQINEAKHKIDRMENVLNEAHVERYKKSTDYTTQFKKKHERLNLRPNVITPTLENANQHQLKVNSRKPASDKKPLRPSNLINDITNNTPKQTKSEININQKKNNASYVDRFREKRGLPTNDPTDDLSVGTQESSKSWKPPKKNVSVISKESLDFYY